MDRSGGAERIYCELANFLAEAGHKVTCLYFDGKKGDAFYRLDHRIERINLFRKPGIAAHRRAEWSRFLPAAVKHRAEWDLENAFFVRQLNDYFRLAKPDVAISLLPPANTPTLLAARGTPVKVIACNHNVPEQDYENPQRWSSNPVDRQYRLKALDNAAGIHVLFPEFGTWFPDHLQDRIVAIPNYISPDFVPPDPLPAREKTILAVGRLAGVKNYMQLIESWAAIAHDFPDWTVRIFGVGPQRQQMKDKIISLGVSRSVEMPGHRSELSDEYARASIFCHPALFEGFGLSPAEALFLGAPVVSYADCAGVNQFVKNGYNGLAVARDSDKDELAAGLRTLIEDDELRLRLGRNGPESVSEFTFDRYKTRWLDLIKTQTGMT